MKILQVQFQNRNGHTLRGIVTLPDTEGCWERGRRFLMPSRCRLRCTADGADDGI